MVPRCSTQCLPGVWSFAGNCRLQRVQLWSCGGTGDLQAWDSSGRQCANLVDTGRPPAGGTWVQPELCHEPAFPCRGAGPPLSSSDILKPLVRGRSISHVSLACGIKSNERTLLIYHKRWGQAFLNNCLCAVAASLGDQQHRLGIHEGVARCPRPKSRRCRFPATEPAQGQNVPQASLLPLPGGRGTREVLLVA